MTPPRSLGRYAPAVRLRRALPAHRERHETQGTKNQERRKKDAALPFFHRLRPLTSITKSDALISGGETRQDYKDPRRFPLAAPSCALLFLPFGLPVSFRCYGRVCLIPRLTLSSG